MPKLLLRKANNCAVLHLLLLSKYLNSLSQRIFKSTLSLCGHLNPRSSWIFKSTPEQLSVTDFYVMCDVVIAPALLNYLF